MFLRVFLCGVALAISTSFGLVVADGSEIVPYQMAMMLGRTYDMGTDKIGIDLFHEEDTRNPQVEPNNYISTKFAVETRQSDVRKLLEISSEVMLKIKAGIVEIGPLGIFIKNTGMAAEDPVVVLIAGFAMTHVETLHGNTKHRDVCSQSPKATFSLGTHYVRSLQYGEIMSAAVRFYPDANYTRADLMTTTIQYFGQSGEFEDIAHKLKELEAYLPKDFRIEIQLFATGNMRNSPRTISDLLELYRVFWKDAGQDASEDPGVPLWAEVFPIRSLPNCGKLPKWERNFGLALELDDFEERFNDVLAVRNDIHAFISQLPSDPDRISDEILTQISRYSASIKSIERKFYNAISNLDVSANASLSQLDKATDAYFGDEVHIKRIIHTPKWLKMKREIEAGGWCEWSRWSTCDVTCSGGSGGGSTGKRRRSRTCACPRPLGRGGCGDGAAQHTEACGEDQPPCPTQKPPVRPDELVHCVNTSFVNMYREKINFGCANNSLLTGVRSEFDANYYDRTWAFTCCGPLDSGKRNFIKGPVEGANWYGEDFKFNCEKGYYLIGIFSGFGRLPGDRKWAYQCIKANGMWIRSKECANQVTQPINTAGQSMDYRAPDGMVITGFSSEFDGEIYDRVWRVYLCPYTIYSVSPRPFE